MRKVREVLRLKYESGRSHAEIAASVGIGESTVGDYLARARRAGLDWDVARGLDEGESMRGCFATSAATSRRRASPSTSRGSTASWRGRA